MTGQGGQVLGLECLEPSIREEWKVGHTVRASLRVRLDGEYYCLRLTDAQRALLHEALVLIRDCADGDISSVVLAGVSRAGLTQTSEKLSSPEARLTLDELHVLFAALTAALVAIPSEQEFFTRIGFFKEQAASLANALAHDTPSAGHPREPGPAGGD